MEYLKIFVLGVIQGFAEFLPISSSGHLVILEEPLTQWLGTDTSERHNLQVNIALHLGTLGSILWVYRADLLRLKPRTILLILLATFPLIPAAILIADRLEEAFSSPLLAGVSLLGTAVLLFVGQRLQRGTTELEQMSLATAVGVGLFQVLAITPGISRSGSTIAGGCILGLRRDCAAKFSFLIAIPAILGATVLLGRDIFQARGGAMAPSVLLFGAATSFIVGLFAIRWLLKMVFDGRLHWFAWYCTAVGTTTIIWQLIARAAASNSA